MLVIKIPDVEVYDENKDLFYTIKGQIIKIKHSLVSLAKWESKWEKPFLTKDKMSRIETIDYIRFMTITQNVSEDLYLNLSDDIIGKVSAYIEHPMTATTFSKNQRKVTNREIITAEIIYYWMIALNIPFECQKWHLNRLLTLINVCNLKNQPNKKMSKRELFARNRSLNAARRQQFNSTG